MIVKLKNDWNIIEVFKSKLGYYYNINAKNQTKRYNRQDLVFITYL